MGFGAIFLGIMFLYDFPIVVGKPPHMIIDIFPDLAGWILLYFGVTALSKKTEGLERLRFVPLAMMAFSALSLLKDTLWFEGFHKVSEVLLSENAAKVHYNVSQTFAGVSFDVCMRLFEMAFLMLLFRRSAVFCRKKGEDKLAMSHLSVPGIALVEGVLFSVSKIALAFSLPKGLANAFGVLSQLDNLFAVFLIWYAAIAMVRALIRISD
ncbi:MAG: hypothetical protein E7580_06780 [Ruminococcaceae bacterium]|nr:hypothetical protein [Oscillospiraceae bacterium]